MKNFFHFRNHIPTLIPNLNHKNRLNLPLRLQSLANAVKPFGRQSKLSPHLPHAGLPKTDRSRLIPNDILAPQILNQHQHVKRIGHRIQRPSIVSPHIIRVPKSYLHLHINGPPVRIQAHHANPSPSKRRPDIHIQPHIALLDRFQHRLILFGIARARLAFVREHAYNMFSTHAEVLAKFKILAAQPPSAGLWCFWPPRPTPNEVRMLDGAIPEGLTFDDVLLLPGKSSVMPAQVDTRTCLTRRIAINIPIVASAMDTVTDARLAIAISRQGGLGFVHRNMSIERQVEEVDKVKRSESGMIVDPV